jgi:hypothetical protein
MWLSVGWLNFKCMVWDWVHLDENDIVEAIDAQRKMHLISEKKRQLMLKYVEKIKQIDKRYKNMTLL